MFEPNPNAVKIWQDRTKPVPRQVASILSETRKALRRIERRNDLATSDRNALTALVRQDGRSKLLALEAEVKRASEAIGNLTRHAMKPKPADTATTLRRQAAWQRTLRILERTPEGDRYTRFVKIVQKAGRDDDVDLLSALYEEGPGFAESEGWSDVDSLRSDLATLGAPAEVQKAAIEAKEAATGLTNVQMALQMADDELAGRPSLSVGDVLPGFDGEMYEIPGETDEEIHQSEEARLRELLAG